MLKKVTVMVASKYLAIKTKMRAIETRLTIHWLLLGDKKMVWLWHRHFNLPKSDRVDEDENYQSNNMGTKVDHNYAEKDHNSIATTPISIVQLEAEKDDNATTPVSIVPLEAEKDDNDESTSVIEMVKSAKQGQGKEFKLEDNIDEVADLFIRRFHHQIRLQQQFHSH